jgi:hypothetical protein
MTLKIFMASPEHAEKVFLDRSVAMTFALYKLPGGSEPPRPGTCLTVAPLIHGIARRLGRVFPSKSVEQEGG